MVDGGRVARECLMPLDKSSTRVRQMFGEIAGRYDFLNRLLSLGIDRSWRRKTVRLVPPESDAPVLDVCTGTADLALAYWRASQGQTPVVGTDFCQPMLAIAREKCRRAGCLAVADTANLLSPAGGRGAGGEGIEGQSQAALTLTLSQRERGPFTRFHAPQGITLLEADTLHLPFADATFQIVSVAFGLRNLSDTDAGLREMVRGLPAGRAGGRAGVLHAHRPAAGAIYGWYFQHLLPRIGQALARNSQAAYNYLPQSVGRFPQGEALAERMRAAGLRTVWFKPFTFGVATLYVGQR